MNRRVFEVIAYSLIATIIVVALFDAASTRFNEGPNLILTLGGVFGTVLATFGFKGGSNGKV